MAGRALLRLDRACLSPITRAGSCLSAHTPCFGFLPDLDETSLRTSAFPRCRHTQAARSGLEPLNRWLNRPPLYQLS